MAEPNREGPSRSRRRKQSASGHGGSGRALSIDASAISGPIEAASPSASGLRRRTATPNAGASASPSVGRASPSHMHATSNDQQAVFAFQDPVRSSSPASLVDDAEDHVEVKPSSSESSSIQGAQTMKSPRRERPKSGAGGGHRVRSSPRRSAQVASPAVEMTDDSSRSSTGSARKFFGYSRVAAPSPKAEAKSERKDTTASFCLNATPTARTQSTSEDEPCLPASSALDAVDMLPIGVSSRDAQEDAMMRILAGQLSRDWRRSSLETSALERRLRDFQFAQNKRRDKYGEDRPWGIIGLYEHLSSMRIDLEWAEDAAWRREHNEPYLSWSDFEATRKEGFNKPFFTYLILVVCTIMLIVSIGVNGWKIEPLSVNPMIGPSAQTLLRLGAKSTPLIVIHKEWYRLFTPMFLHAGFIHYFLNMLALWFVGSAVELCHGFVAAAIIFIIPAVGGTIVSALFLPEYISVGASGGIFGLVGACLADVVMNWSLLFSKQVNAEDKGKTVKHIKVLCWLFMDIIVNCILGFTPLIDNFTHLGGMLYGFLCGLSTMERLSTGFFGFHQNFCGHVKELFVRFFGIFVCVAFIMVTSVALAGSNGRSSPCNSCRYVSCVPMPPWKGKLDKWWYCDDCAMVTADAQRNQTTQIFESLSLMCPNEQRVTVDISAADIADNAQLAKSLPTYCRLNCSSTFA